MNIKIALFDNDYVVRAKTDFVLKGSNNPFRKFLQRIKEELIPGETAFLEIEDYETDPIIYEISQLE